MNEFIENVKNYFLNDGVTLVKGITIVLFGFLVIKMLIRILKKSLNRSKKIEKTLPNFIISLIHIGLMAVLIIYALTLVGVSADSVVTFASVLSLGISLALQDTISSLANGIIIIVTKPFVEGEYVAVNGVDGSVVSISMFNTILKNANGQMITIPNSNVTMNEVTNYSRLPARRLDIKVPVAYGTKIEDVKKVLLGVVAKQKGVMKDPEPMCRIESYGDYNLNYLLRVWVMTDLYWDILWDLNEKVMDALTEAKISKNYGQIDVRFKNIPQEGGNE